MSKSRFGLEGERHKSSDHNFMAPRALGTLLRPPSRGRLRLYSFEIVTLNEAEDEG